MWKKWFDLVGGIRALALQKKDRRDSLKSQM